MKTFTEEEIFGEVHPQQSESPANAAYRSGMGGVQTFLEGYAGGYGGELQNQADKEMAALRKAGPTWLFDPNLGGLMNEGVETSLSGDQLREQYRQDNGLAPSMLVELGGMMANPLFRNMLGKYTAANPFKGGFATGGFIGAITGSGKADGDIYDRAKMGGMTALIAAPFGGAGTWGVDKLLNLFNPSRAATNILREEIRQDLPTAQSVTQALKEIGPESRLMDLTTGTKSLALGASIKNPQAAGNISKFLTNRAANAKTRVLSFLKAETGASGDDFTQFFNDRLSDASRRAGELYQSAIKESVSPAAMSQLDDTISAAMKSERLANNKYAIPILRRLQKTLKIEDGVYKSSVDGIDSVRQQFGKEMFNAKKDIGAKQYDELVKIRKLFDEILPDDYVKANKIWSGEVEVSKKAFDLGKKIFTMDVDDIARQASEMTDVDKEMLMAGVAKAITKKVGARTEAGKLPAALDHTDIQDKLIKVFGEETANRYIHLMKTEGVYSGTRAFIEGGSDTARKLAAVQRVTGNIADQGIPTSTSEAISMAARAGIGKIFGNKLSDRATNELADMLITEVGPDGIAKMMTNPESLGANLAPILSTLMLSNASEKKKAQSN